MRALLYLVPLGLFCTLSAFSQGWKDGKVGYAPAEVLAVNALAEEENWLAQLQGTPVYRPATKLHWSRL